MDDGEPSPASFERHARWVDALVASPTPRKDVKGLLSEAEADEILEHVLRGSKSFAARSWRSRPSANSLRVPSNKENRSTNASESDRPLSIPPALKSSGVLGEIAPNNQAIRPGPFRQRPSPTPSLRKQKIESLVKAHGSPTHVRVTAGGRIVPSEQSPLCHPRYGYSAIKVNGGLVKFAPNHPVGKAQWTQATENGFVAQDVNGRLCQIVDGVIMPLTEIDGALQLFMPAPNLNITQTPPAIPVHARSALSGTHQQRQPSLVAPPEPSNAAQISALELEYSKLDLELKDLNKTEVLHGKTMGKVAKDALFGKRRELITNMDNVRKALKSLREQAPSAAPVQSVQETAEPRKSFSPSRNRLPPFLQQRQHNQPMPPPPPPTAAYGPFFGPVQSQPYPAPFGFQSTPSPEMYGQPWSMPPAAMFLPPPAFDGTLSTASLPYQPEQLGAAAPQASTAQQSAPKISQAVETRLPQHDGSRSFADVQKLSPPRHSHALPIKVPEHKGLKSNLNPMSPVYKPGQGTSPPADSDRAPVSKSVKDRAPTPLMPFHQLQPATGEPLKVVNTTDETISPVKKHGLPQSSSISSFETADFFPRNTREYSTRKHEYPEPSSSTEDKENSDPQRRDSKHDEPRVTSAGKVSQVAHGHPIIVHSSYDAASPPGKAPGAPPGTPVDADKYISHRQLPLHIDGAQWKRDGHGIDTANVPDRSAHNLSPKTKRRDFLFVEEDPAVLACQPSPSPEKFHACQDELCVQSSPYEDVDFLKKPREYVEGYQAGVNRHPPGFDRTGDWLEGYCAALMKAKPSNSSKTSTNVGRSDGSPTKSAPRRASLAPAQQRGLEVEKRAANGRRPALAPIETHLESMDSLKQAVFAPHNENAVLTPAADGPHVNESAFNLGAWARVHGSGPLNDMPATVPVGAVSGYPDAPRASSSSISGQINTSDEQVGPKGETLPVDHTTDSTQSTGIHLVQAVRSGNQATQQSRPTSMSAKSHASSSDTSGGARVSSITSIDSHLYRHYPGHRIFSPHLEYKSISSVAQHAGLASGFFAQAQFDGAPQSHRPVTSDNTGVHMSKFSEGSLDGMSNPPNSPPPPMSPKISPEKDKTKDSSPTKGSPARAKFEHIAEKVGIKVSNTKDSNASSSQPGEKGMSESPGGAGGKRRWHSVWTRNRKEASKDETTPLMK